MDHAMHADALDALESEVRYYSRRAGNVFVSARGAVLKDADGREIIDFLSGCGSLNYGHNHPEMKRAAIAVLESDGLVNSLDFRTPGRAVFIRTFGDVILKPRGLDHRLQFTGPTGANAVEAALKLARKATGRLDIVAFERAYHGVSLGALAVTDDWRSRATPKALRPCVSRLAYDSHDDLVRYCDAVRAGEAQAPAAFIVETIQGEGGLRAASQSWLKRLAATAEELGALLIVDDIQAGCGRSGTFFSFEQAKIVPDIVVLSKSISGLGLPMALLLVRPAVDVWAPGEHNGTFRGCGPAFATASVALDLWSDPGFQDGVAARAAELRRWAEAATARFPHIALAIRGRGLMLGLLTPGGAVADAIAEAALETGVLVETAGPDGEVVKFLPPLTIEPALLAEGLDRVQRAIESVASAGDGARKALAATG